MLMYRRTPKGIEVSCEAAEPKKVAMVVEHLIEMVETSGQQPQYPIWTYESCDLCDIEERTEVLVDTILPTAWSEICYDDETQPTSNGKLTVRVGHSVPWLECEACLMMCLWYLRIHWSDKEFACYIQKLTPSSLRIRTTLGSFNNIIPFPMKH